MCVRVKRRREHFVLCSVVAFVCDSIWLNCFIAIVLMLSSSAASANGHITIWRIGGSSSKLELFGLKYQNIASWYTVILGWKDWLDISWCIQKVGICPPCFLEWLPSWGTILKWDFFLYFGQVCKFCCWVYALQISTLIANFLISLHFLWDMISVSGGLYPWSCQPPIVHSSLCGADLGPFNCRYEEDIVC